MNERPAGFDLPAIIANYDLWELGLNHILWITGLSGGGKGYIAKKLADSHENTIIFELDKFENFDWYFNGNEDNEAVRKGDSFIRRHAKEHFDSYPNIMNLWINDPERYHKDMCDMIKALMEFADQFNRRVIVEGVQIFMDHIFRTVITRDSSCIFLRSPFVHSMQKVMHREHNQIRNLIHSGKDPHEALEEFIKSRDFNENCTIQTNDTQKTLELGTAIPELMTKMMMLDRS